MMDRHMKIVSYPAFLNLSTLLNFNPADTSLHKKNAKSSQQQLSCYTKIKFCLTFSVCYRLNVFSPQIHVET